MHFLGKKFLAALEKWAFFTALLFIIIRNLALSRNCFSNFLYFILITTDQYVLKRR